jgi:hypothetical protein
MKDHIMPRFLLLAILLLILVATPKTSQAEPNNPKVRAAIKKALDYLERTQLRQGYWEANNGQYKVAMTALAGNALACEGSTTTQGKYSEQIKRAVDFLTQMSDPNTGLIGYSKDYHYMYGHGFSMLFLSQVYGEEENEERRKKLKEVLTLAVKFCGNAQTKAGGWGYVSDKDGNGFDEGSTCITQVQGLRACRNAGIPVPREIIENGKKYIRGCMIKDGPSKGGVQYSIRGGGARPAITAAGLAAMFNAGDYDSKVTKIMLEYCEKNVWPGSARVRHFGHWHYMHYYYAQVMYRLGDKKWKKYFDDIGLQIIRKQSSTGAWNEGHIGPVYTTAINATILQLENNFLPIYQR